MIALVDDVMMGEALAAAGFSMEGLCLALRLWPRPVIKH